MFTHLGRRRLEIRNLLLTKIYRPRRSTVLVEIVQELKCAREEAGPKDEVHRMNFRTDHRVLYSNVHAFNICTRSDPKDFP